MGVSGQQGMGAIPFQGGAGFRVWAPFASSVAVAGSFNDWSIIAHPLTNEGNGNWSTDVPGASVGAQYKFVLTTPFASDPLWRNDPYARCLTNSAGNSIVPEMNYVWKGNVSTPAWNELVIYELHVGSFRFDPGSRNGRGNFDTVIGQLPYLSDLGINAIQLLPSDEFPGDTSWGYNPSYIFAIEESYGGPNGLRRLVDAAHEHGIAVIYDVVYNHFGPNDLDLWRFDGWSLDDWGGIYFYNDWRANTPWGEKNRPDYGRGEVRQYIRDNALFWLEQFQCDGLRFDATGWIRNVWGRNNDPSSDLQDGWSLLQWINRDISARQPWKITIAEDMQDNEWITSDEGAGGAGFGAQWGAGFMHVVRGALIAANDSARDVRQLRTIVEQRFNANAFKRVVYTESHDEVADGHSARIPELIWPGNADGYFAQKRSTLGAALVFTVPGIPMIFMGQEFLESGKWSDARSLDWSKAERFAGIRTLYRDLIRLRRNLLDTTRGLKGREVNVHHVNPQDAVIAFHRWEHGGQRDDVVVVLNFANRGYDAYRIGFPRGGRWRVRFNSDWRGYSPVFTDRQSFDTVALQGGNGDNMPFGGDIGLGPYAAVILSQDD
jgi:1,4-alpha-glucan branching enzyme